MNPREIIEVTAEDIQNGKKSNPYCCPIAQALQRLHPRYVPVVDRSEIRLGNMGFEPHLTAVISRRMARFIHKFDTNQPVHPARFLVEWR